MNQEFKKNYQIKSKKTLNERVYDSLKQMILDNALEPNHIFTFVNEICLFLAITQGSHHYSRLYQNQKM